MRLNYLQGGGHDPNVLHKFTEMEYDARFKDTSTSNSRFLPRPPQPSQIGILNFNSIQILFVFISFLIKTSF